jgi:hypothetical protein
MHRLALILLATGACVADGGDEGFDIVHNLSPGNGCTLSPGGAFISGGRIEQGSPTGYLLTPEFSSRITAPEGSDAQRTIALRGARVKLTNATTNPPTPFAGGEFTALFSASLPPGGKSVAAFEVVPTSILDQVTVTADTRVTILAKVTAFGALGGSGDTIDGVEFQYPITVCQGCVAFNLGACPLAQGTMIPAGNPCNQFQDGTVGCCQTASGLLCPAITATAAR